jgi:hypothetical protein
VIVRPFGDQLLLVTQPDHAALAAAIMSRWRRDGLEASPRRGDILLAVRAHDDGWVERDRAPSVDPSGHVVDFLHLPDRERHRLWPLGVARLSAAPYAAALVAEHAIQVHGHHRASPGWEGFFAEMTESRRTHLAAAAPATDDDLRRDYFFIRMGDLLSLTFCSGWIDPQRDGPYEALLDGARLTVGPDPFAGTSVPLAVSARCLPNRPFAGDRDAAEAFAAAPVVSLTGVATGAAGRGPS